VAPNRRIEPDRRQRRFAPLAPSAHADVRGNCGPPLADTDAPKFSSVCWAYFLLSCAIAAFLTAPSERPHWPIGGTDLGRILRSCGIVFLRTVVSPKARQVLLSPDAAFGGSKWGFVLSGVVATAFTGAFVIIAVRGCRSNVAPNSALNRTP